MEVNLPSYQCFICHFFMLIIEQDKDVINEDKVFVKYSVIHMNHFQCDREIENTNITSM